MNRVFLAVLIAGIIFAAAVIAAKFTANLSGEETEEGCKAKGGIWKECGPNECQKAGGDICPTVCGPPYCSFER